MTRRHHHHRYPRRFNGSEYYKKSSSPYAVDENGRQVYAKDRFGNEVYPPPSLLLHPDCPSGVFAKDETDEAYYARDADGNEIYPCVAGKVHMIPGRAARYKNGTQRYPADVRGNEYYPSRDGKPYLLLTSEGRPYLAKSRRGYPLIPWNFLQIHDDTPYLCTRDAGGTVVYVHENDLPQSLKMMCDCLCRCASHFLCPALLRTLLR